MPNEALVSVIIPVYNTPAAYLRQCLDSVLAQSLREIEIILVDDGSTDGSLAILREYERRDGRVRVLTQENINAGAARNHGLRYARGEYLSFLDADDFFEPDMLEKAYVRAKQERAEVLVFCSDNYETDKARFAPGHPPVAENLPAHRPFAAAEVRDLFDSFMGWAWDKLFLRSYVEVRQLRFQEQRTTNDLYFTYFALAAAERISLLDELLAHHRVNNRLSLENTRVKSWTCFYTGLCALRDGLREAGLYERFERDFVNYSLNFSLWQLRNLAWPTQELLYYQLRLLWFGELGVLGREAAYFYREEDYAALQQMLSRVYGEVYPAHAARLLAREDLTDADPEIKRLALSCRIGSAVTVLPWSFGRFVHVCRKNGLAETARLLTHRLKK